ncbi:MAG: class I SAM-dependent methyltransferase [Planctomycetes bacterium]|nr:class I SAM-dependent methyltransferase [Planctomycetota bacterium]
MSTRQQATVDTNINWFQENEQYIKTQRLECYQHIKRIVQRELRGVGDLLDVGNGGFFNYDTSLVGHVTAVDLFLRDGPGPMPNSTFRQGSFLELPFADASFDCVLQQNVFHHVTGRTVRANHHNMRQCLGEMFRCLRPGGKAVILESTVGPFFYLFECVAYRPVLFLKRRGHPVTFQFTPRQILRAAESFGFVLEEFTFVPRGWFLNQLGYIWPSILTPAKPIKLVLRRPGPALAAAA